MPTYQYMCTDCGEPLEAVQSFTEPSLTVCPACGGTLRKVFSAVGVVFKGSGFYRTDSRSGAGKGDAAAKGDAGRATRPAKVSPAVRATRAARASPAQPRRRRTPAPVSSGSSAGNGADGLRVLGFVRVLGSSSTGAAAKP